MKIPSKRELRHIASNPSSDIEFKGFFYVIYIYIYTYSYIQYIQYIYKHTHQTQTYRTKAGVEKN